MDIYTMEQWEADGTFKAAPGQQISEGVYNTMLNCLDPLQLPQEAAIKALEDMKIPVHAGFLMGEPHSNDSKGLLYLAFGKNDYGKGPKYYYLGLARPAPKLRDGYYYYFDCMNAFINDGLYRADTFEGDQDAIDKAADYEATLYKYEFRNGEKVSTTVLYEPMFL